MPLNIDPSKPTQEEILAHNMKVAKANLACDLARNICSSTYSLGYFRKEHLKNGLVYSDGPPDQDAVARLRMKF